MWKKGKKAEVKAIVIAALQALITQVEQYLGSGKGQEKLDKVLQEYNKFVEKLPFITKLLVKTFFSEAKIRNIIEDLIPQVNNLFKRDSGGFEYFKSAVVKTLSETVKNEIKDKSFGFVGGENMNTVLLDKQDFEKITPQLIFDKDDTALLDIYAKLQSDFKEKTLGEIGIAYTKKFK
jgi:hypothetical protein